MRSGPITWPEVTASSASISAKGTVAPRPGKSNGESARVAAEAEVPGTKASPPAVSATTVAIVQAFSLPDLFID